MNRKLFIILVHVAFFLVLICSIHYIKQLDYEKVDVASLNLEYKEIEDAYMAEPSSIIDIERAYHCDIVLVMDKEYKQVMYHAIQNGYTVFDLCPENQIIGKVIFSKESVKYGKLKKDIVKGILVCIFMAILIYDISAVYLYRYYVKPFKQMNFFASEVAKGNLDVPIAMKKHNYFGVFTESFDVMREELKIAKQREYEANQSKKELIASLSHDMKTPIATIEASCEVLMLQLKENACIDKVKLIADRAQMINSLINNMFHATLEELEVLELTVTDEPSTILNDIVDKVRIQGGITVLNACPECMIRVDRLRITQVIDNIINNAKKYADTIIEISYSEIENGILLMIRDFGPGVDEKSLPLLTNKFYRADNAEGKTGAGLGMYLANYFMTRMEGEMEFYNDNGFVVELFLRKSGY